MRRCLVRGWEVGQGGGERLWQGLLRAIAINQVGENKSLEEGGNNRDDDDN